MNKYAVFFSVNYDNAILFGNTGFCSLDTAIENEYLNRIGQIPNKQIRTSELKIITPFN